MVSAHPTFTLFLIEDHPLVRQVMCRILEDEPDLTVIGVAVSAEEALEQLRTLTPDLVLSDLLLPGESGAELVSRLQKTRPGLPCVIVSANDEPFYRTQALDSGALEFVRKDDTDRLVEVIRQTLAT